MSNFHSGDEQDRKFETKLIHFGGEVDRSTGASSVPIYQASTFHHHDIYNPPEYRITSYNVCYTKLLRIAAMPLAKAKPFTPPSNTAI